MAEPEGNGEEAEAARRFEQDLEARAEVVPAGTEPLPPGTTHETEEEGDGEPGKVRRRRFSAN